MSGPYFLKRRCHIRIWGALWASSMETDRDKERPSAGRVLGEHTAPCMLFLPAVRLIEKVWENLAITAP